MAVTIADRGFLSSFLAFKTCRASFNRLRQNDSSKLIATETEQNWGSAAGQSFSNRSPAGPKIKRNRFHRDLSWLKSDHREGGGSWRMRILHSRLSF